MIQQRVIPFLLTLFFAFPIYAQQTGSAYQRVQAVEEQLRGNVFRQSVVPRWNDAEDAFWYRIETGPAQHEFVYVDAEAGNRRLAFDHEALAQQLGDVVGERIDAKTLPFRWINAGPQGEWIRFSAFDETWQWTEQDGLSISPIPITAGNRLSTQHSEQATRRNGEATTVRFVNDTDAPVNLFWMDWQGSPRSYGSIDAGGSHVQNTYAGHVWKVEDGEGAMLGVFIAIDDPSDAVVDGTPVEAEAPEEARPRNLSPDGQWMMRIENHNVWVEHTETGEQVQLSHDGVEENSYQSNAYWSPDSSRLVVFQTKKGDERIVHFVESAPDDQLQPKLHSFSYTKPGDVIDRSVPRLFDIEAREPVTLDESLYDNPFSISDVHWWPGSDAFCFFYNQRGHQVVRVLEANANTGAVRALIDEESDTFVDYARKKYLRYLDDTREIIWMSERSGWNHLCLIDALNATVKHAITSGEWVVRGVERVDVDKRRVWLRAGGIIPEQDPYYVHLVRVDFNGSNQRILTHGDGTHTWRFSPNGESLIDTWSRVDQPPITVLRDAETGSLLCDLERADDSALQATGWQMPEPFVARGRDGETDIYGVIFRPPDFDPAKTYPVIEEIYAGPHGAFVPKSFNAYPRQTGLASLGFIVVQIDGMGTSHRSKAFHDVCWKNLGDSGFPDRIAWMKAAAALYPQMDLSRVGIYGGSAGGQSALRALLAHGEFYHVAVADCGCHDNRMDKIWWNELWMGWPIGPQYEEQSNVTQAHRLEGDLLLIVGEVDRNVDPTSTMQVVDALIKADKDFDMLVMPGVGHGAMGTPYGKRRMLDFFVENLK